MTDRTKTPLSALLCAPILLALLALSTGCGGPKSLRPHPADLTDPTLSDSALCADLTLIPQDLELFAHRAGADRPLMDAATQAAADVQFNTRFFSPWSLRKPRKRADAFWAHTALKPERGYSENNRPFTRERWAALVENSRVKAYPGPVRPAITVRNTALRLMPTATPYFLYPRQAGEGFPFDYFQNSAIWAGTPVALTHTSGDAQWVYAESSFAAGWLPVQDVAVTDEAFMRYWRQSPLVAVLDDASIVRAYERGPDDAAATPARNQDMASGEAYSLRVHIGAMLPLASEEPGQSGYGGDGSLAVLMPLRGTDGRAIYRVGRISVAQAAVKPLAATPGAIARIGNRMMGQPYGWGGMFENRDCSAATRDLLAPFGVWLPRNSAAQGRWGTVLPLTGLSPDAKEARISAEAIPFFSLLWLKGHITLYVGSYPVNGREVPVMFHSIWGLRVMQPEPAESGGADAPLSGGADAPLREGRVVIGKTVITTLRPGAELPGISSPASLLDRIEAITLLSAPLAVPLSAPASGQEESDPDPGPGSGLSSGPNSALTSTVKSSSAWQAARAAAPKTQHRKPRQYQADARR